jgi:hypothetical protein
MADSPLIKQMPMPGFNSKGGIGNAPYGPKAPTAPGKPSYGTPMPKKFDTMPNPTPPGGYNGKPKFTPMPKVYPAPGSKLGPKNPSWSNLSSPVDKSNDSNRSVGENIASTLASNAKGITNG